MIQNKAIKILFIIAAVILIPLLAIYINHKIHLQKESSLLTPVGHLVEVDGHSMSIYIEGSGDITLVFIS